MVMELDLNKNIKSMTMCIKKPSTVKPKDIFKKITRGLVKKKNV